MLTVESPSVGDILLGRVRIKPQPFRNLCDTFRPEGSLRVNVGDFAFCSTHVLGQLCDDGHGVGELGFAATEFAVDFADAHALESTTPHQIKLDSEKNRPRLGIGPAQDAIELLAPGRDLEHLFALMAEFHGSYETIGRWLSAVSNTSTTRSLQHKSRFVQTFLHSFLDLFDLGFAKPLDLQQGPASGPVDGLEYHQHKGKPAE